MAATADDQAAGLGSGDLPSLTLWIVKRLALSVLILLGVSILVFAATQALPGDPARQILGHAAAPDQLDALRTELGLDRPLLSQYLHWLGDLLGGSFGTSLTTREPVSSVISDRGLNSLALVLCSAGDRDPALARCSARSRRCAATARSTTSRRSCCSCSPRCPSS